MDGDGRGDVIVGAHTEDVGDNTNAGRAYVFNGSNGELLHVLLSPNAASNGQFGHWVSGVPDVNGDGRGDVIVGAWKETPGIGPYEAGQAYIFDGEVKGSIPLPRKRLKR